MFFREQLYSVKNQKLTQTLFYETNQTHEGVVMTLGPFDKEHKGKTLISLKRVYMECADPTEYDVAMKVFGSWNHWQALLTNKRTMKYIQEYREELDIQIRSEAVKALIQTATQEGSKGTAAAKYIAEKGWDKRKAGAPSRLEKKSHLKVLDGVEAEIEDDFQRLNLTH